MANRYNPQAVEAKWQQKWRDSKAHQPDLDNADKKLYSLTMFSYPSGDKLHVGHWYNYGPADTWSRFKRIQGFRVFHPQGFDAFGMPAENYAIKHGVHPAKSTKANIATMRKQLDRIGAMYDWSNYVDTSTPEYYKWTQWLFLKLYDMGLAVHEKGAVNWCDSCETVLANEQVKEGLCERCGNVVMQKDLQQWFFKITQYADELLDGLDELDWPDRTKTMQRNWIGRSVGAHITFDVKGLPGEQIKVFTTRPDTIYGATYMVLAPEHTLVEQITTDKHQAKVTAYQAKARSQTERDRISQGKEKTGVNTGGFAINPFTKQAIPVWIADYVLASYGTGAIMAVPGSDERDHEFARKFGLEIVEVVSPDGKEYGIDNCYAGEGIAINSGEYTGLSTPEMITAICNKLVETDHGHATIQYRLRDWCISRQRYWGAPIPIIHCDHCGTVPVPERDLPVELPMDIDLAAARGKAKSPLATVASFFDVKCPKCEADARRETDTMDTFVDSAWYFLRYPDAHYAQGPFNPERVKAWLPVDMYIGGIDHATMHLLYARFFIKALRDAGLLEMDEPFTVMRHQGVITADGAKMSKSKDNVVSPDSFIDRFGSDVFRSYLMFMGPYDEGGDWNDSGINGLARFQDKVWRLCTGESGSESEHDRGLQRLLHISIREVGNDLENLRFNTAISRLMELSNGLAKADQVSIEAKTILVKLLSPIMPHICEEIWEHLGHAHSIFDAGWPQYDEALCKSDQIILGVTINGRRRGEIEVNTNIAADDAISAAKAVDAVAKHLAGKDILREIYVPGRLVNFVINE